MADWALVEVERLDTYTEITPSGTGLRAWFLISQDLDVSNKKLKFGAQTEHCGLEFYVKDKFLTVTGDRWPGSCAQIERRDQEVKDLYERMCDGRVGPPEYRRRVIECERVMNEVEADYRDQTRRKHMYVDTSGPRLDVEDFCRRHSIRILRRRQAHGLTIYAIECHGAHGNYPKDDGKAWIGQDSLGKLAAGCFHSSCDMRSWRQLRDKFEPRPQESRNQTVEVNLEFQHPPAESTGREYVLSPRDTYDGWFRRDAVHVVGGSSGAGKSTFMLDLLATQARRAAFLGHESSGLPFLVIFAHRPQGAVDETLERMGLLGQVPAEYLKPCWGAVAAATILKKIEEHDLPAVVFIEGADILVEDACRPKDVAPFLSLLQEIALRYHLALVLSVGAPKTKPDQQYTLKRDRIFGTQVWSRMAETIVLMTQTTDEYREVDVLHRNAMSEHFDLMFANGQLVVRTGQIEQEVAREHDPLWQWIAAKKGHYFYRAEAVKAMADADAGLSRASVYRRLSEWAEAGFLEAIWDSALEKEYLRQRKTQ